MTDNTDLTIAKPNAPAQAGGKVQAIVPQNSTEAYALSKAIYGSGLAPNNLKNADQVMVVIMKGSEVGFAPMQALSTIALINGRLSIYGDGLPAIVYRAGGSMDETIEGNGDSRTATCVVTRKDGHVTKRTFSVSDARNARLWGKSGPWSQYPDRMLQMRARGFAVRDGMADALNGLYVAEDVQDAPKANAVPDNVPESASRLQKRLGTSSEANASEDSEPAGTEVLPTPVLTDEEALFGSGAEAAMKGRDALDSFYGELNPDQQEIVGERFDSEWTVTAQQADMNMQARSA